MKFTFKFLLILILFILFFIPNTKCFGINMNLMSNDFESNTINDEYTDTYTNYINDVDDSNNIDNSNSISNTDSTPSKTVTVTSTDSDEFLTVENVLSIILIVIGILLIFLGIAIIIRFK